MIWICCMIWSLNRFDSFHSQILYLKPLQPCSPNKHCKDCIGPSVSTQLVSAKAEYSLPVPPERSTCTQLGLNSHFVRLFVSIHPQPVSWPTPTHPFIAFETFSLSRDVLLCQLNSHLFSQSAFQTFKLNQF